MYTGYRDVPDPSGGPRRTLTHRVDSSRPPPFLGPDPQSSRRKIGTETVWTASWSLTLKTRNQTGRHFTLVARSTRGTKKGRTSRTLRGEIHVGNQRKIIKPFLKGSLSLWKTNKNRVITVKITSVTFYRSQWRFTIIPFHYKKRIKFSESKTLGWYSDSLCWRPDDRTNPRFHYSGVGSRIKGRRFLIGHLRSTKWSENGVPFTPHSKLINKNLRVSPFLNGSKLSSNRISVSIFVLPENWNRLWETEPCPYFQHSNFLRTILLQYIHLRERVPIHDIFVFHVYSHLKVHVLLLRRNDKTICYLWREEEGIR